LGEHELSLYLRGVGVKYCDKPIVIGCIGELLEYTLFPIVGVYWEMGDCWRCSSHYHISDSDVQYALTCFEVCKSFLHFYFSILGVPFGVWRGNASGTDDTILLFSESC